MTARDSILRSIRAHRVPPQDAPSLDGDWLRFADLLTMFQSQVEAVGGRCVRLAGEGDLAAALRALCDSAGATQVVSRVAALASTVSLDDCRDPHDLADVEWAVLPGQLGVAENGAVWVDDRGLRQRAIYFIVQHLALVVQSCDIVHNMHEAYQRIALDQSSLGVFISGPSKTADIEQSLVIGAHGPRSLTVFCVG